MHNIQIDLMFMFRLWFVSFFRSHCLPNLIALVG